MLWSIRRTPAERQHHRLRESPANRPAVPPQSGGTAPRARRTPIRHDANGPEHSRPETPPGPVQRRPGVRQQLRPGQCPVHRRGGGQEHTVPRATGQQTLQLRRQLQHDQRVEGPEQPQPGAQGQHQQILRRHAEEGADASLSGLQRQTGAGLLRLEPVLAVQLQHPVVKVLELHARARHPEEEGPDRRHIHVECFKCAAD